jgi:hypothetical protein
VVGIPDSPYADKEQTLWFSFGYREGWLLGNSGANTHPDPYPQHQQFNNHSGLRAAHVAGFDSGFEAGFKQAQERIAQIVDSLLAEQKREPVVAFNSDNSVKSV